MFAPNPKTGNAHRVASEITHFYANTEQIFIPYI